MPILSLRSVVKEYSGDVQTVRALDDVTLDIAAGEFVALVGRSGCGKSTLLNLAGAMDFPTSGTVLLDGVATAHLGDELTRHVELPVDRDVAQQDGVGRQLGHDESGAV